MGGGADAVTCQYDDLPTAESMFLYRVVSIQHQSQT